MRLANRSPSLAYSLEEKAAVTAISPPDHSRPERLPERLHALPSERESMQALIGTNTGVPHRLLPLGARRQSRPGHPQDVAAKDLLDLLVLVAPLHQSNREQGPVGPRQAFPTSGGTADHGA